MIYPIIAGSWDGGGACGGYPEYTNHAALPVATGSGTLALVLNSTYASFPPRLSGFWRDDTNTGDRTGWARKAPYSAFFLDTSAVWYDDADDTKRLDFQLENITTGNTRTITMADANVDLADIATNTTAIGLNTTHRTSDGSDHTFIDQDVTSDSSPTLDGTNFTGIPNGALDETYLNADGTVAATGGIEIEYAGTVKAETDFLSLINTQNAADMDGTGTTIKFEQYYYDASTPAAVDSGKIAVITENDWTSTASTQDAYMAFSVAVNGVMTERMRIDDTGLGVATTSPDATLSVNGTTTLNRNNGSTADTLIKGDTITIATFDASGDKCGFNKSVPAYLVDIDGICQAAVFKNEAQTITYAASITPDVASGAFITVGQLTGNISIALISNDEAGMEGWFKFTTDATDRTITWNSANYLITGGDDVWTMPASTTLFVRWVSDGTNIILDPNWGVS